MIVLRRAFVCALLLASGFAFAAEEPSPTASPAADEEIIPTWETQKSARAYVLDIPAPRGQITDRNGAPLAQNKLSYNIGVGYPTPLEFNDSQVLQFTREKIAGVEKLLKRSLKISDDTILRHYHNRGILPFEIAQNLNEDEFESIRKKLPDSTVVRPLYVRVYPNGKAAGHIIGYCGKTSRNPDGMIDNHEILWPETEGREGLEQTFNQTLTGQHGQYKMTFDKDGRKTSEKVAVPPVSGNNVVTTLDLHLQQLAEEALESKAKRGAIVVIDPNTGDILAMASWPSYNPNIFIPAISAEKYRALENDPDIPLLPRAFRSAYPPGSTFKVAVGIAALENGVVGSNDTYNCVPALQVGNMTFHNWKKTERGDLNFVQALTESCDTWFYQVGIKTGPEPIIDWAQKLGFGAKCGIPLRGEAEGRVPNDQYMKATHGRKLLNGDVANLSIGQGDVLTTPLQMAQSMAVVANGGTFYQTRLVQQVQNIDSEIVTAYQVREKKNISLSPSTIDQLKSGLVDAVNSPAGTAHAASMDNVEVAGKTGTAQWGPKAKERTAAWFAGYLPSEKPQYAFAALYEGEVGSKVHGGTAAAPMIGKIFKELYKGQGGKQRRRSQPNEDQIEVRRAEPAGDDSD